MRNRKIQLAELIEAPITGEWGNEITDINNQNIVKVIRTTNFTNNGEIDYSNITLRNIEYTKCEKKKLKYGDIILEKSGGTDLNPVGRVVFFDKNDTNDVYLTNNFTTTLRVKNNKINSKFLLLFLLYNYKYKGLHKFYNKTTGIQNLQVSNLIKNTYVPLPETNIQSIIVEILDKIKSMIKKREKQILLFDELIKSRFIEMFGDPIRNEKGWEIDEWKNLFKTQTGKLDSNAMVEGGKYPFFTCAKEIFYIDEYLFNCEALILAGNNAAGIYDVKYYNGKFNAYQRTYVINLINKEYSYIFFKFLLESKLKYLKDASKGSSTRYLTISILNNLRFILPPLSLQNEFAEFVTKIDKLKFEAEKSLKEMENLYESLMQKFFKQN